ncbi:hypothetical protein [Leptothoe sp. PORK10 BA2]|uniref:hypothetical protein n=1 Tax=Leptothoe sp. PORK10 BA2 TaxID=3110254 RepID=UPI002B20E66D|nr:hypothetical protein [Leptothoe sp. PORK10 BA2]MEA5463922.1 hypothetical protein [Leptothoe sp. PORK10 BA2]
MVNHGVKLRGLRGPQNSPIAGLSGDAPTILRRLDENPIAGVLADLAKPGLQAIANSLVTQFTDPWRFYQPVHRVFHVALLEAVCDPFGADVDAFQPRLDPLKIDSAGLVLRRYTEDSQGNRLQQQEGWRSLENPANNNTVKLRGWIPLPDSALTQDPQPQRSVTRQFAITGRSANPPEIKTGRLELDRQLSVLQAVEAAYSEQVHPLFVAPPEVCEAIGKTVLYALIPLTSQELSAAENVTSAFGLDFVKSHLSEFLTATLPADIDTDRRDRRRQRPNQDTYEEILRQLSEEFELLKNLSTSRNLVNSLNRFSLFVGSDQRLAGNELKRAAQQLSEGTSPTLPAAWGVIDRATGEAIAQQVKAILDRRITLAIPQLNRFDELDRDYSVRAFIRVKSDDGCPPKLWWSPASNPFTIRRWYENTPVAPVQIALPDLIGTDLSKLTPNVTFAVPAGLFNAIDGMTLDDLLNGKKPSGGGPALDWICGFNIPIITICAFIVLNIFLQLLNFIFFWLPFIKICVPIPRSSSGGNAP